MNQFPNGLRITIGIIFIMVFVDWTQSGGTATTATKKDAYHERMKSLDFPSNVPYKKKTISERMRLLRTAEAYSNCTCPKDTPVDTKRELCGWEILERTSPSNDCQKHTVYRCMDPHPWKAIDQIPCGHWGKRNTDKVHQKCDLDLETGHTYMRHCVV
jgi:hypothetical protein